MTPYERLMQEGIPRGLPPKADTGDGPTACMMRVERARLLWQLAHSTDASVDCGQPDDISLIHNLSNPSAALPAMNDGEVA